MVTPLSVPGRPVSIGVDEAVGGSVTMISGLSSSSSSSSSSKSTIALLCLLAGTSVGTGRATGRGNGSGRAALVAGMLRDNVVFVPPSASVTQPESEASTMVTVEVEAPLAVELEEVALDPALALMQLAAEDDDVSLS